MGIVKQEGKIMKDKKDFETQELDFSEPTYWWIDPVSGEKHKVSGAQYETNKRGIAQIRDMLEKE